jgi:excisionase family DNA binding protein
MEKTTKEMPDIMTAKELATYLKMSPEWGHQTIQRMARQGKIKGTQIGDLWRFTKEQVQAFLAGQK